MSVQKTVAQCRVCGTTDILVYHKNGAEYRRPFCKPHWNEYQLAHYHKVKEAKRTGIPIDPAKRKKATDGQRQRREQARAQARADLPAGWERNRSPKLTPPEGIMRIIIYPLNGTMTTYYKNIRRTQRYVEYGYFGDTDRLVKFLIGLGYKQVKGKRGHIWLEKQVEKGIELQWQHSSESISGSE